jgi:hypothetical protein
MKYFGLEKIVFVFVLLCSPVLQAEDAYEIEWADQFSKSDTGTQTGESIATDSNGNTYVTGFTTSSLETGQYFAGAYVYIIKYNADGLKQWSKQFSDELYYGRTYGKSITVDNNNNIVVTGYTWGTLPGKTSSGNVDAFLAKYDTDGNNLWIRQFGTDKADYAYSVTADSSGNLYVVGKAKGAISGSEFNVFVAKYDSDGIAVWNKELNSDGNAYANSVATDSNGIIYVTGYISGNFANTINQGMTDVFLAALDADGSELWIQQFGTFQTDVGNSVTTGKNNNLTIGDGENIYVAGYTYAWLNGEENIGDSDGFIVAFSKNGTQLWTRLIGSTSSYSVDKISSIATDDDGNLYTIGMTNGSFRNYPPLYTMYNLGKTDLFVTKISSDNELHWLKMFGTKQSDGFYRDVATVNAAIAVDNNGNIFTTGTTNGQFTSTGGPGPLANGNYWHAFVAKLPVPTTTNIAPLANAGADSSVAIGTLATLNGLASSDPDLNYPLTYAWSFSSVPFGSENLLLSAGSTVNPTFTPEVTGDYVVNLVVTDNLGLSSLADAVTVNTYNTPPNADAGSDQAVTLIGSLVALDGSGSFDDDDDVLSYNWTITQKPAGSGAGLDNPFAVAPTFIADVNGDYQIGLTVTDTWGAADTDEVLVSFSNVAPVADAGANQSAVVGEVVMLNGGGSSDANGDPITFNWSLSTVPEGNTAVISDPSSVEPSFTANLSGTYIASLVVNDGIVDSVADSAEIVVVEVITTATEAVSETIALINDIPEESFRNVNLSNALTNKLNAVLKMITNEQYGQAWNKLTTDILPKTDGCALYGVPDKKDWIETCEEQELVYNHILETIVLLEMNL